MKETYISEPWFKDVKDIKETASKEETEQLISTGKWKLLMTFGSNYSLGCIK